MISIPYALEKRDFAAAKRLVRLGADPSRGIGEQKIPVAFVPVIERDKAGVLAMRQAGVDYDKIQYHGATAFDVAKRLGDSPLLAALGDKGTGT